MKKGCLSLPFHRLLCSTCCGVQSASPLCLSHNVFACNARFQPTRNWLPTRLTVRISPMSLVERTLPFMRPVKLRKYSFLEHHERDIAPNHLQRHRLSHNVLCHRFSPYLLLSSPLLYILAFLFKNGISMETLESIRI